MTTHWADLAVNFKIQDAACLMAGVPPPKELIAWADHLPPEARPIFERLWNAYMVSVGVYEQPAADSLDYPKMLHAKNFLKPTILPARGFSPRQESHVAPSAELMLKRLERIRVPREELYRWVQATGIKSAYDFAPQDTQPQPVTVEPATATVAGQDAPVVALPANETKKPDALPTRDIAELFDGVKYTKENWPKRLSGTLWLVDARAGRGEVGGVTGTWWPLTVAQLVCARAGQNEKARTLKAFNSRFKNNPALAPWRDAWIDYYDTFSDTDDAESNSRY